MAKAKRVAFYLRVSTDGQTTENQRRELEAVADARGWSVVGVYCDEGISGAKGRDKRPGIDAMLKDAVRGSFDVVMAWSVDRLGRSLLDLVGTLQELHGAKVDLFLHQQALDTTTPGGKAMFGMMAVFAEFERSMIVSRVNAGLARAQAEQAAGIVRRDPRTGKRKKLIGRPAVDADKVAAIREHLAAGKGIGKISRDLGVGSSTVQRVRREGQAAVQAH